MADRHSLTKELKEEAHRLGFDLVGITTPDPPAHVDVFRSWIEQGRHASMEYLASDRSISRRADPRAVLPGCRSIVVVGVRHSSPPMTSGPRLAAYAQGRDYHDVIVPRLQNLMTWLETIAGEAFDHRVYTDTGPILERELAQRAGLGWIGKNTCLIHPREGSYFLLGEALTTLDLVPDQPFEADRCGSCTRCLDACPTGCILPDRTLDSARCVSYLTIENRGPIPPALRSPVGPWLFGCDICQEVCPWNQRFAQAAGDPELRSPVPAGDPAGWLDPEVPPSLRGSALARARRSGMARNAAVVLGNTGGPDDVSTLGRALDGHAESLARSHAAWALGRIGGQASEAGLRKAAQRESDPDVRDEIRRALQALAGRGEEAG